MIGFPWRFLFFKDARRPAAAKRCGKCRQCIFIEKALPKLLQSFEFAKTLFFGLSSTLAKLVFIDRAQPRDAARCL